MISTRTRTCRWVRRLAVAVTSLQNMSGKITVFSVVLSLVACNAWAANWYVRSGATGAANGQNWTNAWTDVANINWSSLSAGDTIYVAGGSYGILTIGKSGSSGSPILIERVRSTDSAATSASGWHSSFDSTVTLSGIDGSGGYSYWTVDGRIPQPNCGMQILNPDTNHPVYLGYVAMTNVTLSNLLISSTATDNSSSYTAYYGIYYNGPGLTNFTLQYSEVRDAPTLISLFMHHSGTVITHNLLHNNYPGNSGSHPNVLQTIGGVNVTFSYNEITNWQAEGIMMDCISSSDPINDHWWIYSNLWHDPMLPNTNTCSRFLESQFNTQTNIFVYHNTIVNAWGATDAVFGGGWDSNSVSKDNIFFQNTINDGNPNNCYEDPTSIGFGNSNDDYNFGNLTNSGTHSISNASTDVFTTYNPVGACTGSGTPYPCCTGNLTGTCTSNYSIASTIGSTYPRGKGTTVDPINGVTSTDFAGKAWASPPSIGAYEYVGSTGTAPSAPKNLSTR